MMLEKEVPRKPSPNKIPLKDILIKLSRKKKEKHEMAQSSLQIS